ncbi:MAG: ABC transporter permease [Clostridia bacterium]
MFSHVFVYRLKSIIRDRQLVFWTLMFPILLATLFNMAFSNLSKAEEFVKIPIAIIDNEAYQKSALKTTIAYVSEQDNPKNNMFLVTLTTRAVAEDLLKNNKVAGYIFVDQVAKLVVKQSGLNQSILKSFLDDFNQSSKTFSEILKRDPSKFQALQADAANRGNFLKETSSTKNKPDTTVNYFYTLIAMACLYGGYMGMKEIIAIQADMSPQGARQNLAPVHKMKVLLYDLSAALVVHYCTLLAVLAYIIFVLRINFGDQIGYILLLCLFGSMTGLSFGAFVGAALKKSEGVKIGILTGVTMSLSFFAGMMYVDMKYIVTKAAPIMAYINPANVITDGFYALYYYDTHTRYFMNLSILVGFFALFCILTYLILRRRRYASI